MFAVELYTSPICGFCHAAKRLLDKKGVQYKEYDVFADPSIKQEMVLRANGRKTVPQIFINNSGIGGCDELRLLEKSGKLNALLESK